MIYKTKQLMHGEILGNTKPRMAFVGALLMVSSIEKGSLACGKDATKVALKSPSPGNPFSDVQL